MMYDAVMEDNLGASRVGMMVCKDEDEHYEQCGDWDHCPCPCHLEQWVIKAGWA